MKPFKERRIIITKANLPAGMTLGYLAGFINESLFLFANTTPEAGRITETIPVKVLSADEKDESCLSEIRLRREPMHKTKTRGPVKKELLPGEFPKNTIFDRPYEGDGLPPYPIKEFLLLDDTARRMAIAYSSSEVFRRFARCCPQCSACRVEETRKRSEPFRLWCSRFYLRVARNGNCRNHDSYVVKDLVPDAPESV